MSRHWKSALALILLTQLVVGCGSTPAKAPAAKPKGSTQRGSSTTPPSQVASQPDYAQNHPVNGCNPITIWGHFCFSGPPDMTQSSAGMVLWSHIQVGQTVEINGATALVASTMKPYFDTAVLITPQGLRTSLPIQPDGGFDESVTFSEEGTYQFYVARDGEPDTWGPPVPFDVTYVPHPLGGDTLQDVFPDSSLSIPGDVVIVYPVTRPGTTEVQFTTYDGTSATDTTFKAHSAETLATNASGVATVDPQPKGQGFPYLVHLYGALFALPYVTATVSNGVITAWPSFPYWPAIPKVSSLVADGTTYYDIGQAIPALDPAGYDMPGAVQVSFDEASGTGTLETAGQGPPATIDAKTGAVDVSASPVCPPQGGTCTPGAAGQVATVSPLVQGGAMYLDVPDLVKVLNVVAWASLSPGGTLRVADFEEP